jgi:hypothetical protein
MCDTPAKNFFAIAAYRAAQKMELLGAGGAKDTVMMLAQQVLEQPSRQPDW